MAPSTEFVPVELPSKYAKASVAILTATVGAIIAALTDNHVSTVEVVQVLVAVVTAIGVYLIPNLAGTVRSWSKLMVAVIGTALQAGVTALSSGGFTTSSMLIIVLAALGAVSVGIVPNAHVVDSGLTSSK